MKTRWSQIQKAQGFLRDRLPRTRLLCSHSLRQRPGAAVYLKLETEMPTGSFKVRGALFALHAEIEERKITEVVAASTGNHGAAVAYAARLLGTRAKIFVPCPVNPVKRNRIQELGAAIVEDGGDITAARSLAAEYSARTGAFVLDDATNPNVPAGTATIACEILQQLPDVGAIWVPIGDSALIRGIASAARHLQPNLRIIGVVAERAPAYYLSWRNGVPITTDTCDTIADGLATRAPVAENVQAIHELVDDVRLVSEEQMLNAIQHLWINERIIAEPAGAATTAAWLAHASSAERPEVLLVTGANVSEVVLRQALKEQSATGPNFSEKSR
jgi:threonine dehydratase